MRVRSASATWAAGHGGLVTRSLQAVLAFPAALKQVSNSDIELLDLAQIVSREIGGRKNRQELGIEIQSRIGPQVCRDLLRLVLQNQSARRLQRVIVRQRQINRLIQSDQRGALCR